MKGRRSFLLLCSFPPMLLLLVATKRHKGFWPSRDFAKREEKKKRKKEGRARTHPSAQLVHPSLPFIHSPNFYSSNPFLPSFTLASRQRLSPSPDSFHSEPSTLHFLLLLLWPNSISFLSYHWSSAWSSHIHCYWLTISFHPDHHRQCSKHWHCRWLFMSRKTRSYQTNTNLHCTAQLTLAVSSALPWQ